MSEFPVLSICIPTYNRASFLDGNLSRIIPCIRDRNIPVCISDNASTDSTRDIVERHKKLYPNISYRRNDSNLGVDPNISAVLAMAETDYAWLLSDDDRLFDGAVDLVLKQLEQQRPDMILVNAVVDMDTMKRRVPSYQDKMYNNMSQLLDELLFHASWMSIQIWSRKLIAESPFGRFNGSAFDFFHAMFAGLAVGERNVLWLAEPCVYIAKGATISWGGREVEILAKHTADIVMSLPDNLFTVISKADSLKKIGAEMDAFSLHGLFMLKKKGAFNYDTYRTYKKYISMVTSLPMPLCFLVALLPPSLFRGISAVKRALQQVLPTRKGSGL